MPSLGCIVFVVGNGEDRISLPNAERWAGSREWAHARLGFTIDCGPLTEPRPQEALNRRPAAVWEGDRVLWSALSGASTNLFTRSEN